MEEKLSSLSRLQFQLLFLVGKRDGEQVAEIN